MNDIITNMRIDLEKAHVRGIPEYIKNLQANSNSPNFEDLRLEGEAARMFSKAGFCVTLRESPDLALRFNNKQFYAEVKHFRKKEQDIIDDAKMSEPGDELVLYGDTCWEQVYDVAKHKIEKYKELAPYILVIESSSNCVEDGDVLTVINTINEDVCLGKCLGFAKLNGILLITVDWYNNSQRRKVYFYPTSNPTVSLSRELSSLLDEIRQG
ncbi:MAG: hypothetical protein V3W44_07635 [Dehalococcoidales bacterium]